MLNNSFQIKQIDRQEMVNYLIEFPQQCRLAWEAGQKVVLPKNYRRTPEIVIAGMGGSGISGQLVKVLPTKRPVITVQDYQLPSFVNQNTLVILISYSGQTKETFSCLKEAQRKKAKIFIITGGGALLTAAKRNKLPCLRINYSAPPRAALGWLFIGLLSILNKLDCINLSDTEIKKILKQLDAFNQRLLPEQSADEPVNLAKQLSKQLGSRFPMIVGAEFLTSVAYRWQTQLAENSKQLAFSLSAPELCHNFIETVPEIKINKFFVFLLQSQLYHPNNRLIITKLKQFFQKYKINCRLITSPVNNQLGQMLGLILLGDWFSYYLARRKKINPTPVKQIKYFKRLINRK